MYFLINKHYLELFCRFIYLYLIVGYKNYENMGSSEQSELKINPKTKKLFEISKDITEKEFKDMKILCRDSYGAGVLEKITTVTELFVKIEKSSRNEEEEAEFFSSLFENIGRKDLYNKLYDIKEPGKKLF